jgi:hypothetical protein
MQVNFSTLSFLVRVFVHDLLMNEAVCASVGKADTTVRSICHQIQLVSESLCLKFR